MAFLVVTVLAGAAIAAPLAVVQVDADPFTNVTSQHQTQVESDVAAVGSTVVAVFQAGRYVAGGSSSGIRSVRSTDAGATWSAGTSLPITTGAGGTYGRATDPSIAYDSTHSKWIAAVLACPNEALGCLDSGTQPSVVVSTSSDGLTWSAPITTSTGVYDKPWIACDNESVAFSGRCYVAWIKLDQPQGQLVSRSDDGGASWTTPVVAGSMLGAQPVVRPDGSLVIVGSAAVGIEAIRSTDGGQTFGTQVVVGVPQRNNPPGMRATVLPTAAADGAGTLYVAWYDCRFRFPCGFQDGPNDIVYSTSADGTSWSAPARVPIDDTSSGIDHFIPELAIDPTTSGSKADLGLSYYFYQRPCTAATCQLRYGFIQSTNAGGHWRRPKELSPTPMPLNWIANTSIGRMVGDYMGMSFASGKAVMVFSAATQAPDPSFHQLMFATAIAVH
jgi:hypothetical protein